MPHKHTRRQNGANGSSNKHDFDLPPTIIAQPLSVTKKTSTLPNIAKSKAGNNRQNTKPTIPNKSASSHSKDDSVAQNPRKRKRKNKDDGDDTPAAFKRLMRISASRLQPPKPTPSTSIPASGANSESIIPSNKAVPSEIPKFDSQRNTDPSLSARGPIDPSLSKSGSKTTRLQKKLNRKLKSWHDENSRLKSLHANQRADERESMAEKMSEVLSKSGVSLTRENEEMVDELLKFQGDRDDNDNHEDNNDEREHKHQEQDTSTGKRKTKSQKTPDDWEEFNKSKRVKVRLGDVVQEPPRLVKVREVFKVKNAPKKKEVDKDLGEARLEVIRRYREMMGRNRFNL